MTDNRIEKIRAEIEEWYNGWKNRLYNTNPPNPAFFEGGIEICKHFLSFIDSLQEEPVSIWHDANEKPNIKEKSGIFVITSLNGEYIGSRYYNHNDITINFGNYDKWAYLNDLLNLSNVQRTVKDRKEPVSEDLGEYINELSKQFPEVSFAKLSRIAVRVAKWQKEQMMTKAIDGTARPDDNEIWCNLTSNNLEDGDKVKVIVIKKD